MPKTKQLKEYEDEIIMFEIPEGGDIEDVKPVAFTAWEGTMKNQPTQPVVFYAKIVGFEDSRAPSRNWQKKDVRIKVEEESVPELKELLDKLL